MNYKRYSLVHVFGVALLLLPSIGSAAQPVTTMVSVDSSGAQGNDGSYNASLSADGRYVAFESGASNLVTGDTNGKHDLFVRDRQTGQTTRVSVDSSGNEGNDASYHPWISADGRYVAFESVASNLVAGDTNGMSDVFVRDRETGQTSMVSVDDSGNVGNGASIAYSISADGRYVAFVSYASNLVAGDTNGMSDVFVRDREIGKTSRVSVDSSGNEGNDASYHPWISADGRYVAFESVASNLVSGDTNATADVFVHDRQTGQTTRVSVDSNGNQGSGIPGSSGPSISADGRYVAFGSYASNLVSGDINDKKDVFVRDRQTGTTTIISVDSSGAQGNNFSENPSIFADGRYVTFYSGASNLVSGDTNNQSDVFVRNCETNQTTRVSVDSSGNEGAGYSSFPSLSADGRYVAFESGASNLVAGDTNGKTDIFVRGPLVDFSQNNFSWGLFLPAIIGKKQP